ncbi:MAG: ATP phosphoribosyltransferase, partial [Verrucomicrobiales bacterium]
ANKLRIVDELLSSFPHFYASPQAYEDEWKKEKMDRLVLMIKGALLARDKVGLKMNLPSASLDAVLELLPSLRRPTVSPLADTDAEKWVAVETVIEESVARHIIPSLKEHGAEGIIEYPLNKIVP